MSKLPEKHQFVSFDGGVSRQGELFLPDQRADVSNCQSYYRGDESAGVIARGAGMSFSAASFGSDVLSVDMRQLKRIEVLEPKSETVTVEAGVSVGALLQFLIANGFHLPILPGYPTITIGGCIAADVHGKNQPKDGCFSSQLLSFKLHHVDYGELEVSRVSNSDIFNLSLGGFGLTGTILSVTLNVASLPARFVDSYVEPIADISQLPETLATRSQNSDFVLSWHDFNQTGSRFGSGYLQWAQFPRCNDETAQETADLIYPLKLDKLPMSPLTLTPDNRGAQFAPLLNNFLTVGGMNSVYDSLQKFQCGSARRLPVECCYFPNKTLRDLYFHAFGKKGLFEHQVIIPNERFTDYIDRVRWWLARNDLPITIASAKMFNAEEYLLRFSASGICFALDFPRCEQGMHFLRFLDAVTVELGALPNIFKDSRLPRDVVEATYSGYEDFRKRLRQYDPKRRYKSELSQRLEV
jgi:decaprenylphospho-beta-D-ribofuranose 2-oxidase